MSRSGIRVLPGTDVLVLLAGVAGCAVAGRARPRAVGTFYSLTAADVDPALGPRPALHGEPIGVPGPYALLMDLPGFNGMRVPARLWMLDAVSGRPRGLGDLADRVAPRATAVVAVAILRTAPRRLAARVPVVAVPGMRVTTTAARARLGLPLRENETETMYGAIAQARPSSTATAGSRRRSTSRCATCSSTTIRGSSIGWPRPSRSRSIVETARDVDGAWKPSSERTPASGESTSRLSGPAMRSRRTRAFAPAPIPGTPLRVVPSPRRSTRRDIGAILDGDLDTRWHTPSQAGDGDRGRPRTRHRVTAVVLCLGAYPGQYPRGLTVEVSPDGVDWSAVYWRHRARDL